MNRTEMRNIKCRLVQAVALTAGSVILLYGCCKRKLKYPDQTGQVEITLDWSSAKKRPSGAELRFYPTDGSAPLKFACRDEIFRGELPQGTYRVIVHNTDAANVSYRNMEGYSSAAVFADPVADTRGTASIRLSEPLQVYGTGWCGTDQPLEIKSGDTLRKTSSPVALTRTVSFRFDVTNMANIASMTGSLDGVAAGAYLATGAKSYDYRSSTAFVTSVVPETGGTSYQAQVQIFGLSSQDEGETGSNTAEIVITQQDGTTHQTQVDISDAVRETAGNNGGEMPLDISVRIELTLVGTHLTAMVYAWDDSGAGGGVVE